MATPLDRLPLIHVRRDPADVLFDEGDIEEGEGFRVTLLSEFLLIEFSAGDKEGELWLPMADLLAALARQTKIIGN